MYTRFSAPRNLICSLLFVLVFLRAGFCQDIKGSGSAQDLEDLLNTEVSVASAKPALPSEAPAVVSVVTRKEIEQSGARDLIDVLRMVPGFDFGVDIWNVVGLGFRGMWGHEGKIKLTVDGMSFNDIMYGNVPYGSHFPVETIERIEIIRGPGSTVYGNFAELAVINVVTQIGAEVPGLKATSTTGFFDKSFARQNGSVRFGSEFGTNGYYGLSVFGSLAQRSANVYKDVKGSSWDMKNDSNLQTGNIELIYRNGGLSAGFIYDNYRTTERDSYGGPIFPSDYHARFVTYNGQLSYKAKVTDNLTLAPFFEVLVQQPWRCTGVPLDDPNYYDPTAQQYRLGINSDWDLSSKISTTFGLSDEWQKARYGGDEPVRYYLFPGGAQEKEYNRFALFNEWLIKTPLANVTGGLRVEKATDTGYVLAPRLALTRSFDDLSLKLIYNRAFRTPAIEQRTASAKAGTKLNNETSDNYEFEVGYRFSNSQNIAATIFYIDMQNTIVYTFDPILNLNNFINEGAAHSAGAELQYRFLDTWGHLSLGYSYYRAIDPASIGYYHIPGKNDLYLAFPAHKATLDAGYKFTPDRNLNITMILTSARYGYDVVDADTGNQVIKRFSPEPVTNLYLLEKNVFRKGLDIGVGVFDVFGVNHAFIQPYNNRHTALPGPGREYLLRISYTPPV